MGGAHPEPGAARCRGAILGARVRCGVGAALLARRPGHRRAARRRSAPPPRPVRAGRRSPPGSGWTPLELARLVVYDDVQTAAAALLKLDPCDPADARRLGRRVCPAIEDRVADDRRTSPTPDDIPALSAPSIRGVGRGPRRDPAGGCSVPEPVHRERRRALRARRRRAGRHRQVVAHRDDLPRAGRRDGASA